MKLAISTLVCPEWTLRQIAEATAEYGIGGIDFRGLESEIDVTRHAAFTDEIDQTLRLLQSHKLAVPCLNTSVTLVAPAAQRWQMMLQEAQRNARLSEKTHTRFLRVFGGALPKFMSRPQATQLAQRHLRQLIKICSPFGCIPLVETHDDWTTAEEILALIHEFSPEEVGVLWDIEHPFRRGETPADTHGSLRRFIRHVHVKDSIYVGSERRQKLIGQGDVPVRECCQILRNAGYDGWIGLETEKRWQAEAPEPQESIPHFARFMRELAGPIAR